MHNKTLIYEFNLSEIKDIVKSLKEPTYRADQLWQGLYRQYWYRPDEFTNFKIHLRETLWNKYTFQTLFPESCIESQNGDTQKCLFKSLKGFELEAVLMNYSKRRTICLSSQSGCGMGCVFCATGQMGFRCNLTRGEIIEQIIFFSRMLKKVNLNVTHVVFMGMGEPFHNYEAVMSAVKILVDPDAFNISERRITISTVGLVPMIYRFSNEKRQINLSISLHAASDDLRSKLVPINNKYPLDSLFKACQHYVADNKRRISFEWVLINGLNDTEEQARLLVKRLRGLLCRVNLIMLNPTRNFTGKATEKRKMYEFKAILEDSGIPCTIRLGRGGKIEAGCGQLATRKN